MAQVWCKYDDGKVIFDHFADEDKLELEQKKSELSEIRTKLKVLDRAGEDKVELEQNKSELSEIRTKLKDLDRADADKVESEQKKSELS